MRREMKSENMYTNLFRNENSKKVECTRCLNSIPKNDISFAAHRVNLCYDCSGFIMSRYSFLLIVNPTEEVLGAKKKYDDEIQIKLKRTYL